MNAPQHRTRSVLPALGVFGGGFVYALLPTGTFGAHDSAVRAIITAAAAGVTAVLIFMLTNRRITP
jgi:hypothetical protein